MPTTVYDGVYFFIFLLTQGIIKILILARGAGERRELHGCLLCLSVAEGVLIYVVNVALGSLHFVPDLEKDS